MNEGRPGRKPKEKNYNSIFSQRLRELVDNSHIKHEDIARVVGVSRQAFSNWYNGVTIPDIICASKIAKYFNISLDYLVGNSDTKPIDADLQAVCSYIGLSDNVVQVLRNEPLIKEAISEIICNDKIIFISIDEYLNPRPINPTQYEVPHKVHKVFSNKEIKNMSVTIPHSQTLSNHLLSIREMEEITMRVFISDRLKALRHKKEDIIDAQHNPTQE